MYLKIEWGVCDIHVINLIDQASLTISSVSCPLNHLFQDKLFLVLLMRSVMPVLPYVVYVAKSTCVAPIV